VHFVRRIPIAVAVAALIGSTLVGCSGTSSPSPASAAASSAGGGSTAKTIKIGFAAPLSGDQAYYGESLKRGADYSTRTFKFTGALAGSTIVFTPLDDVADPAQGVTVAKRFVAEGYDGVFANFNSGVTMATMPIYNEARMPEVTASSSPKITQQGFDNVAQVAGNDNNQGKIMADFLKNNLKLDNVAVFNDSGTFGQGVAGTFSSAAQTNGTTIVDNVALNPQSQDFRGSIGPVLSKNPAAVYFGGTVTTGGLLCNQLRAAGFTGPFMGPDGVFDPKLMQGCGSAAGSIYVSFWYPPTDATPELVAFDKSYKQVMGLAQGPYDLEGYLFMDYLLTAINTAGTTDHEAVIKALHSITYKSILGDYKIDANGLRADPVMYVYKAEGDKFTYVP